MSHGSAQDSVMMQVPNAGAFVRALLPVRLTAGHTVTFGVWLAIHPEDLKTTFDLWWDPACPGLRLDAWLANAIPPWGYLASPVEAAVRDPDQTPYCITSPDDALHRVLTQEWDHRLVLDAMAEP
jgi:hypothetical protein